MSVTIKSEKEIELMREAGRILAIVHEELRDFIRPGISTMDIDKKGYEIIKSYGCIPSFLNYNGYPGSICASINDVVIHGIPKKNTIIKDGDIISIDIGACYKGYHGDAARTHMCGNVSEEKRLLVERTKQSLFEGLKFAKPNNRLSDISHAIETYVKQFGYGIVLR